MAVLLIAGCGPKTKNKEDAKPGDGAKQSEVAKVDLAKGPSTVAETGLFWSVLVGTDDAIQGQRTPEVLNFPNRFLGSPV